MDGVLEAPSTTEMAVALGLDWIVIDAEHGHLDWKEIVEHLRCSVRSKTVALIRIAEHSESMIKRALDLGADGVVVPRVETANQLRECLSYCLYPPKGTRGIGAERATGWGMCFKEHVEEAAENPLLVPIVESVKGIENAKELSENENIEVFFFGPADLSASAGYTGEWEGPGVSKLIASAKKKFTNAGKKCGVVARNTEDLKDRLNQGFRMVAHGMDTSLLAKSLRESMESVGQRPSLRPGFDVNSEPSSTEQEGPRLSIPESFRPKRKESMNPAGQQEPVTIADGVSFDCQIGAHNKAVDLTTGTAMFQPGAILPYHIHAFGESITLVKGQVQVEVDGRIYTLSPLDNVSIPAGLKHRVTNLSDHLPAVFHIAMASSSPNRDWVEEPSTSRVVNSKTTLTYHKGERFTSFANTPMYEPGQNARFVDYFNSELIPGFDMSGGYGIFKPGGRLPAHIHDFDESICIVDGTATCVVEGCSYGMDNFNTALQPRGRVHYFINESSSPMAMIWVYAGHMPERIVVDERLATEPGAAWPEN